MLCIDETCVWNQHKKTNENVCPFSKCIMAQRRDIYAEKIALKRKPHLTIAERARLAELNMEWNRLMLCVDAVRENS